MKITIPRFHKWMGVAVGLVFLLWVVTGVVIILPARRGPARGPTVDYSTSTLSPAQAVALVAGRERDSSPVSSVTLLRVGSRCAYQVSVSGGRSYLLDAASGTLLAITAEFAEQIAKDALGGRVPVKTVERLAKYDFRYPAGRLPIYRVAFTDRRESVAYVSTRDGSVRLTDRDQRLRAAIGDLHTFQQVELVGVSKSFRLALLHVTSLVSVVVIATGYYMSLPKRRSTTRQRG